MMIEIKIFSWVNIDIQYIYGVEYEIFASFYTRKFIYMLNFQENQYW